MHIPSIKVTKIKDFDITPPKKKAFAIETPPDVPKQHSLSVFLRGTSARCVFSEAGWGQIGGMHSIRQEADLDHNLRKARQTKVVDLRTLKLKTGLTDGDLAARITSANDIESLLSDLKLEVRMALQGLLQLLAESGHRRTSVIDSSRR